MADRQNAAQRGGYGRVRQVAVAALLACVGLSLSTTGSTDSESSRTVIKVADATFTVGEIQARMAQFPGFQLRAMGDSPSAVRRAFADKLVTTQLMVEGARVNKLNERSDVNDRIRAILRSALLSDMRRAAANPQEISNDEVRRYYELNKARYQSPKRIKIWQIMLASKEEADALLKFIAVDEDYRKDPLAGWEKLAREKSIDKSTHMRRGNVGFVEPSGATAHRALTVDPALYQAAATVQDGQLVTTPVKVKGGYAIVQRRGSHGPVMRTLAMEASTIRNMLAKERVQSKANELLAKLRKQHISEIQESHVDQLEMTPEGQLGSKMRPGVLPRRGHAAAAPGRPKGRPGHMH